MKRTSIGRSLIALVIFAALVSILAGCGIKTKPVAGKLLLPDRVSAPSYVFTEDGVLKATFKPPIRDLRGMPLKDLAGFYVERSENALTPGFCPSCPVEYTERIEVKALPPDEKGLVQEVNYQFEDRLETEHAYYYKIFAHDGYGGYDDERFQELTLFYGSPPRPPDFVRMEINDDIVFLTWPIPDRLADGSPIDKILGYDLYRRANGGAWEKLNMVRPIPSASFEDTLAKSSNSYEYKVRTVIDLRGTLIAGPASPIVSATPIDLTPPPPPVSVYTVSIKEGIKATWPEVEAADLAGYRLYRRTPGRTRREQIGPGIITDNLFLDVDVKPGGVYYYQVTSVDNAASGNESKPTRETKAIFTP